MAVSGRFQGIHNLAVGIAKNNIHLLTGEHAGRRCSVFFNGCHQSPADAVALMIKLPVREQQSFELIVFAIISRFATIHIFAEVIFASVQPEAKVAATVIGICRRVQQRAFRRSFAKEPGQRSRSFTAVAIAIFSHRDAFQRLSRFKIDGHCRIAVLGIERECQHRRHQYYGTLPRLAVRLAVEQCKHGIFARLGQRNRHSVGSVNGSRRNRGREYLGAALCYIFRIPLHHSPCGQAVYGQINILRKRIAHHHVEWLAGHLHARK